MSSTNVYNLNADVIVRFDLKFRGGGSTPNDVTTNYDPLQTNANYHVRI